MTAYYPDGITELEARVKKNNPHLGLLDRRPQCIGDLVRLPVRFSLSADRFFQQGGDGGTNIHGAVREELR